MGIPRRASDAGTPRRLSHGAVVVRQGDPSSSLFLIASGAVRLSAVSRDGREVVVALLGPGDMFGESALLGLPSPVEATVIGITRVVGLPLPRLRDVLRRYPATAEELLRLVASRLHRTSTALEEALTGDVRTRLSLRLRTLAAEHGVRSPDGVRVRVPLTQEELGRMVGAARETVNRSLVGLTARGLVRTEGRIVVIPDPEALGREPETAGAVASPRWARD